MNIIGFFIHFTAIDHSETNGCGDSFMVDINGIRWKREPREGPRQYMTWTGSNVGIQRKRKQKKVMVSMTYGVESLEGLCFMRGKTYEYEDALKYFIATREKNVYKLASDSVCTVLELLLM